MSQRIKHCLGGLFLAAVSSLPVLALYHRYGAIAFATAFYVMVCVLVITWPRTDKPAKPAR